MDGARKSKPETLTYGSDNEESRARLRELMLFVAERCQYDCGFGVRELNQILFYADFLSFAKYGKPITGISYNKLPYGPVPTGARATREQLLRDGDAVTAFSPIGSQRMIPQREADLDLFRARDIALVDDIIGIVSETTASMIGRLSHGKAWEAVEYYDAIPYEAALLSNEPPTEEDIARAHELIAAGEWED